MLRGSEDIGGWVYGDHQYRNWTCLGHEGDTDAEGQATSEDETLAALKRAGKEQNLDSGGNDVGKQEGGHSPQDAVGDGEHPAAKLGKDAQEQQPEGACPASLAGRDIGQGDHS